MRVVLKRTWFDPSANRHRKSTESEPTELPNEWREKLPSDARVLDDDKPEYDEGDDEEVDESDEDDPSTAFQKQLDKENDATQAAVGTIDVSGALHAAETAQAVALEKKAAAAKKAKKAADKAKK